MTQTLFAGLALTALMANGPATSQLQEPIIIAQSANPQSEQEPGSQQQNDNGNVEIDSHPLNSYRQDERGRYLEVERG